MHNHMGLRDLQKSWPHNLVRNVEIYSIKVGNQRMKRFK